MAFLLPPPNKTLHSIDGWIIPPLDGSLTVPEIYDFHYENNSNHAVFAYGNPEGDGITLVPYSEVIPAAHRAGWLIANAANFDLRQNRAVRPLVAVLAASDTITFFTTFIGMFRAGIPFLALSPRNSPAALAHLLRTTEPTHLFVSADASLLELARDSFKFLDGSHVPEIAYMPSYEDLYIKNGSFIRLPPRGQDLTTRTVIAHSSGSTSFPKPSVWNDKKMVSYHFILASYIGFGDYNFCGQIFSCHCLAMFHSAGINFINWLSTTGMIMAVFPPSSPSVIPSFDSVFNGFVATRAAYGFVPPIFLEEWSRDPVKVAHLTTLKGIAFGGAPLNPTVGNYLTNEGCKLLLLYGITEAGVLSKFFTVALGRDWQYMMINPTFTLELVPEGDGTYEGIAVANFHTELSIINTKHKGRNAYATNDLFLPHPSVPGLWRLVGRKDDRIVLSSGEKTNPGLLESVLARDPHVKAGLYFGHGRFQNGLLVQLKPQYIFPPSDQASVIKYRSVIWPTVEKMNELAMGHSQLFKEMIIFSGPSKPFSFNAKGLPRRVIVLKEYQAEIDTLYDTMEDNIEIGPPLTWSSMASLAFIRAVVNNTLNHPVGDNDDVFEHGCDSLRAARMRNTIIHALRTTQAEKVKLINPNFIYDHPRIAALADFVSDSVDTRKSDIRSAKLENIQVMLDRHASSFSRAVVPRRSTLHSPGDVILITGTTGGLGAATLVKLADSESVHRIFVINRSAKDGRSLLERQEEALESRGYDPAIASLSKMVLIEADLTEPGFGIEASIEKEIHDSVTHIIHIAWRVDFNLPLSSFDGILKSMRNLIDLALSSPQSQTPKFLFTSSVGVLGNLPGTANGILEQPIDDPSGVVGQGYSESKWLGEQMLYRAAKETSLRPLVVRVGQIAGGVNGSWNTSDWIPAIVKSSRALGCLPEFKGTSTWVPLDTAASAIADLRSASTPALTVHLVHPRPTVTRKIFQTMAQYLGVPLQPFGEWLGALEVAAENPKISSDDIPALKLLQFFRNGIRSEEEGKEPIGIPAIDCSVAERASTHLRNAKSIQKEDVLSWLQYWTSAGFLP
ncbi:acetyl-CoA synthetase-like protein [Guyanagaster necrorhizus]|uniref:Acetyl-CoA synthetase-like protein n=1 Tax=Guyanagaster necrorhizus TaxID=856835 RepID=A0A9P7VKL8_9AGAR|nr:acetyl-CoA synthetase-like protein [Guyanagaster necrorhizus MCA 3950]KAG7442861.1 acetyl-CoA synthetase-like protein [Guyanagaster necrorhizus MCA 3950]